MENVAEGLFEELAIEDRFFVLIFENESDDIQAFRRNVSKEYIQFHFGSKGSARLSYNEGSYLLPLEQDRALLLYNPQQDLPIDIRVNSGSWVVSVLIPIARFHSLFSDDAEYISFLSEENRDRKYYKETSITPTMAIVLNQMMQYNMQPSMKPLYFKGKAYELLSLYFNRPGDPNIEKCPFLADEGNVAKIKLAKQIITSRMAEPPTLQELSEEINLPLNKLKEGFKQVYGDSVFSFLLDYKLEVARQMLAGGSYNVNEVGDAIGYSTASHFIAAFKKKYGTTPKKYLMSLSS